MGGLLNALNTGKVSLSTQQKAIEVVGNNIANVNTPGYSRQSAVLETYPSLNFNGLSVGQSVKVGAIEREQDIFLARQIQDKSAALGEAGAKQAPLAELERIFSIADSGLTSHITDFFDAWSNLAANPGETVERSEVIQQGEALANAFRSTSEDLAAAAQSINDSLLSGIDEVNDRLQQVAELNSRIFEVEANGENANGFRDQRDLLLNELSETIGAQYYEDGNGAVSVQLPGGLPLLQDTNLMPLQGVWQNNTLELQVAMGDAPLTVDAAKLGGQFKGLVEVRDELIPQLQGQLDQLAHGIITEVNALHEDGTRLDGTGGGLFFQAPPAGDEAGGAAAGMSLAVSSFSQVATGASSASGDNTVANGIAALAESKAMNGQDTFIGFYAGIASTVGMETSQNELVLTAAEDSMTQLQNMRDGVVGVSLEEEMISLIQYQKGFDASAKFLSTVDEMMDTILTLKR
jgi:flagellar hook-associated protein 1 FlgK